jgi:hypothetical protein
MRGLKKSNEAANILTIIISIPGCRIRAYERDKNTRPVAAVHQSYTDVHGLVTGKN